MSDTCSALIIPVTCPSCAQPMAHRQSSRPTATEASALMACGCGAATQVLVRLLPVPAHMGNAEARAESRRRAKERASA